MLEGLPASISRYEMEHLGEAYEPSELIPGPIVTGQEVSQRYTGGLREGVSSRRTMSYQAEKEEKYY